jgi:ABC-type Fe3+-hydroxamate transport system substrate-binding protein
VGAGVTITAEARATLTAALVLALADLDAGIVVTSTRPLELATPAVFVDIAARRMADDDGAPVVIVTFPVVAVVDGADAQQVLALDDIGDVVWAVALELAADPSYATPGDIDVDGPRVRTLTTAVDVTVDRITLCPEPLGVLAHV